MGTVARHKILAFVGFTTGGSGGSTTTTYKRIHQFTAFTHNKNPQEYARQYVDEPFQQDDVVGYAPSYDYAFDKNSSTDEVQERIITITDEEKLGNNAVVDLLVVDTDSPTYVARQRYYSVIPGTEGDNINVYTYSGTLKARGKLVAGTAETSDNWETCTFTPDS